MRRAVSILLAVALAVAATVAFLLTTQTGAQWVIRGAESMTSGRLSVGLVEGRLVGPLALSDVAFRTGGLEVGCSGLRLAWRPKALLHGEVFIADLELSGVRYRMPEGGESSAQGPPGAPPRLPPVELPLRFRLVRLVASPVTVVSGAKTYRLDRVELAARADESGLAVKTLKVDGMGLSATASGQVVPRGAYPVEVRVQWAWRDPAGETLAGEGSLGGNLRHLRFVHQISRPFPVDLKGDLRWDEAGLSCNATGSWRDLAWPLSGPSQIRSPKGSAHVTGALDAYKFDLEAALEGQDLPPGTWRITERGTQAGLSDLNATADVLGGKLQASGSLAWSPALTFEAELTGERLDPAGLWAQWPGRIGLRGKVQGRRDEAWHLSADLVRMAGTLRGYAFSARGQGSLDGALARVSNLEVRSGSARLSASGGRGATWDLAWDLRAPDLGQALPGVRGALSGRGRVTGPAGLPKIEADLSVRGLVTAVAKVGEARLEGTVDLSDREASHLQLTAQGAEIEGRPLGRVEVSGRGTLASHTVEASFRAGEDGGDLRLQGALKAQTWQGRLLRADFHSKAVGPWSLAEPAQARATKDGAGFGPGCWRHEAARICLGGNWTRAEGWNAMARGQKLPLALLGPWLPREVTVSGTVDAEARAGVRGGALSGHLSLVPAPGRVVYEPEAGQQIILGYSDALFFARLAEERLQGELRLKTAGGGGLSGDFSASPVGAGRPWQAGALSGRIQANFSEFGILPALVPQVEAAKGQLTLDAGLSGTLGAPRLEGKLALAQGAVTLLPLGIELKDLNLTAESQGEKTLRVSGRARSGPGDLAVNGTVALDAKQGWPARFHVEGKDFEAANLPQAEVRVSPKLDLETAGRQVGITGEVQIPKAEIRLTTTSEGAIPLSPDVVVEGAAAPAQKPWEISSNVLVALGDHVKFKGKGLDLHLGGQLRLRDEPGRATTARGELRVLEGSYEAYRQKLKITQGRVFFAGPVDNPGLDIQAVRTTGEITAGLHVTGTLKTPRSTLFSTPPMAQADVLSYLLLGRPIKQASGGEARTLMSAGASLGLQGGELLAKRIGRLFGLEDVKLETGSGTNETSLLLGKWLSPRLYVHYGVGLLGPGGTLTLRYELTPRLRLEAEGGSQSGVDLLYEIQY